MSSAGAQCGVIEHVHTQSPYAILIAVISFGMYLLAGVVHNALILLPVGIVLTLAILLVMRALITRRREALGAQV